MCRYPELVVWYLKRSVLVFKRDLTIECEGNRVWWRKTLGLLVAETTSSEVIYGFFFQAK